MGSVYNDPNSLRDKCFVSTLNQMGYMARKLDEVQQAFINFCIEREGGLYLDIGAAFGIATLAALQAGKKIISCDLEQKHLDAIRQATPRHLLKNLVLQAGHFPQNLRFNPHMFDGILCAMVLHFTLPEDMHETLTHLREILIPKGRVFVTVSSPYQGVLKDFIPLYEERFQRGENFPGYIANIGDYVPHRSDTLPSKNIVFCLKALRNLFEREGFHVLDCFSFTRENLPSDLSYDGREYTGLIATKA